jgi:hypothetical protein
MRLGERVQVNRRDYSNLSLKNLVEPPVYVRSEVVACLDCGAAQFVIQEGELRLLGEVNGPER